MTTIDRTPKPVLGLVGAPGSGKSSVAGLFAELGCGVIDADRLAHEALRSEPIRDQLVQWWGTDILGKDGLVDRKGVGKIVFDDPDQLKRLEELIHPVVFDERVKARRAYQQNNQTVAIIEDCPLLLETGLDRDCDVVVFVDTPDALRLERVRAGRGWDAAELQKRDKRQLPLDTKRQSADYVIRNDRDLAHLQEQVRHVLQRITSQPPA